MTINTHKRGNDTPSEFPLSSRVPSSFVYLVIAPFHLPDFQSRPWDFFPLSTPTGMI